MKLKDKAAIVIGTSAGMGKKIAYYFAKEGTTVYAAARRVERLKELAESVNDLKGKIIPFAADLTSKVYVSKVQAELMV
jgi:NADP-dependent 3-hydroxy acid dehydrogenase YdfG